MTVFKPSVGLLLFVAGAVGALAACSPVLDWREVRPAGSGAVLLMPCKPKLQTRTVPLANKMVPMFLWSCDAGNQTWALAHADMGDPTLVSAALSDLQKAAAANVGAVDVQALPLNVPGSTPSASSQRVQTSGRLPDGRAVQTQTAVFAHGTVAFQVTLLGEKLSADGADNFFAALHVAK